MLDDFINDFIFFMLAHFLGMMLAYHISGAHIEKVFGGALHKNSDHLRVFLSSYGNE